MPADGLQQIVIPDQQRTDSNRPSKLVGRNDKHISIWKREFARTLCAIGQHQCPDLSDCLDHLIHRIDHARFRVHMLDRENAILVKCALV